ncbi:hypothetical protein ZIOFF_075385 [Zingiber officinale]|uniref:Uncharacterized protein n=1 Tax=Zingiber officinale TaxID=94328 RepID=A0A8J5ESN1_ZINOF|nr:hypothetical protein ZIOFF_075385 [Zingiber officinale]
MVASGSGAAFSISEDHGDWVREALLDLRLPAEVLLSFRRRRHRPEAEADEEAATSTSAAEKVPDEWGRRIKRSRMVRLPRIAEAPLEEEPAVMKRRASPQSPLDLCRSASASSAEKPEVAPRSLALDAEAVAAEACRIEMEFEIDFLGFAEERDDDAFHS